jgi:hypothetical protein
VTPEHGGIESGVAALAQRLHRVKVASADVAALDSLGHRHPARLDQGNGGVGFQGCTSMTVVDLAAGSVTVAISVGGVPIVIDASAQERVHVGRFGLDGGDISTK